MPSGRATGRGFSYGRAMRCLAPGFSAGFSNRAATASTDFAASFLSLSRSSRRFSRMRRRPPAMISAMSWSYWMPMAWAISTRSE